MTQFSPKKEVVINMENIHSDGCTLYDEKEVVHQEQLVDVYYLLKEKVEALDDYVSWKKKNNEPKNDVISVFARRGAGKTTFVKTVVELIRRGTGDFGSLGKDILCLDVLEPNSIKNKENLMIRFLVQIEEAFKEKIENGKFDKEILARYKKAKENLYEAMPVLDGVGKSTLYPDWDDFSYVGERCMTVATNVKELESRFHTYIRIGLEIIQKKALLFVLDDSDVNIQRSFEILEIIRLYFTTPQIIVILTGDAALYGMVVRRKYWEAFDKDLLDKECMASNTGVDKYKEYGRMVYMLESQYLQKMIKPTHRIFLNNLYDKQQANKLQKNKQLKVSVKLKHRKEPKSIEIRKLYKEFFERFDLGKESIRTLDIYINHLLAQPIRNQIRLFSVYDQFLKGEDKETDMLTMEVMKVFEVYINQYSSDNRNLLTRTSNYPACLLKFLVENDILEIGSGLLPKMEDENLKNAIIPLGLSCSDQMKNNAAMIFDYWIRISLTKRLQQLLNKKDDEHNVTDNLISYAKLYSDTNISKILGNMLAYCNGNIIPLRNFSKIKKPNIPGTIIKNRKCYSFNPSSIEAKLIHLLQLGTVGGDNNETIVFSIYRPIAVLGEILKIFNSDIEDDNKASKILRFTFIRSCQIKSFIESSNTPSYEVNNSGGDSVDAYLDKDIKRSKCRMDEFMAEFIEWCNRHTGYRVAPYFIDRVFSRYYYTMLNWRNYMQEKESPLGDSICVQVTALWNAALVETMIMLDKIEDVILDYPVDVNQVFLKNYCTFLYTTFDSLPKDAKLWVTWLLDCPVLKKYVSPFIQSLKKALEKKDIDEKSLSNLLQYEKYSIISNEIKELEAENIRLNEELKIISERKRLNETIENIENIIEGFDGTGKEEQENFMDLVNELSKNKEERNKLKTQFSGTVYIDDDELDFFESEHIRDLENNNGKICDLKNIQTGVSFGKKEESKLKKYYNLNKDDHSVYSILNHF